MTPFHAKVSERCLTSNSLSTTEDGQLHPRRNAPGVLNPQKRGTGGREDGGEGEDGTSSRRRVGRLPNQGNNCETSARARLSLRPLYLPLPNASRFTARKVSQEAGRYRRQLGGRPRALHPSWTLMIRGPCLWVLLLFSPPPAPSPRPCLRSWLDSAFWLLIQWL